MADLNLDVAETVEPIVEEVKKSVSKQTGFINKIPAYWQIKPTEDGLIECYNSESTESFVGTIEEFNIRLKD